MGDMALARLIVCASGSQPGTRLRTLDTGIAERLRWLAVRFGQRNLHPDRGAMAGFGVHAKSARHHLHPLAHAKQAQMRAAPRIQHAIDIEGFPVIGNGHADPVAPILNFHVHAAGFVRGPIP